MRRPLAWFLAAFLASAVAIGVSLQRTNDIALIVACCLLFAACVAGVAEINRMTRT